MPSGGPRADGDGCHAAMKKTTAATGSTAKHAATTTVKHSGTSKHKPETAKQKAAAKAWAKKGAAAEKAKKAKAKVTAKAKPATHAKAVALALAPGDVACCAAEALAASLRLQGVRVSDEDVLGLYWHTADNPDSGASIAATLEAAWRYGLGGVRPRFGLVGEEAGHRAPVGHAAVDDPRDEQVFGNVHQDLLELPPGIGAGADQDLIGVQSAHLDALVDLADDAFQVHTLILGVELPGPHAVLATPDGWWSWGELHDPAEWPDAVIESAWAVTWT